MSGNAHVQSRPIIIALVAELATYLIQKNFFLGALVRRRLMRVALEYSTAESDWWFQLPYSVPKNDPLIFP